MYDNRDGFEVSSGSSELAKALIPLGQFPLKSDSAG